MARRSRVPSSLGGTQSSSGGISTSSSSGSSSGLSRVPTSLGGTQSSSGGILPSRSSGGSSGGQSNIGGGTSIVTPSGQVLSTTTQQQLAAQQQAAIQEKVFSGTIAGQLQGGQPSQIQPLTESPTTATLSFPQAAKASATRFVQRLVPGGERPGFSDILTPFDRAVTPKREREVLIIGGQQFDTERLTERQKRLAQESGAELTTFGDIQKGIETGRQEDIASQREDFQRRIDTGDISLEDAEKQFTQTQKDIFTATPDVPGVRARPVSPFRQVIDLATISTPVTSAIGAQVSAKDDPLVVDVGAIERGASIEASLTQRPSLRTATFVGGTVLGGGEALLKSGRDVQAVRVAEAQRRAGFSQTGFRIPGDKGFVDISSGVGRFDGVTAFQRTVSESRLVDGRLIQTGGKTEFISIGRTEFAGKPFVEGGSRAFAVQTEILPSTTGKISTGLSKVVSTPTTEFSAVLQRRGLVGSARAFREAPIKSQDVIGFGAKRGDEIASVGGEVTGLSADVLRGGGFKFTEGVSLSGRLEGSSVLKILRPAKDSGVSSIVGGGTKTPFSTTFAEVQAPQVSTRVFSPPAIKAPKISPVTTRQEPLGFGLPRSVGGTGLTDTQLAQATNLQAPGLVGRPRLDFEISRGPVQQAPLSSQNFLSLGIIQTQPPRQRDRLVGREILQPKQAPGLVQVPKIKTGLRTRQVQKLDQPVLFATPTSRVPFTAISSFRLPATGFAFPSLLGDGTAKSRRTRGRRARVPIRPSFTGIVLEIETAATPSPTFGVLPSQIRGLATGFKVPKKKKKKTSKKKKKG